MDPVTGGGCRWPADVCVVLRSACYNVMHIASIVPCGFTIDFNNKININNDIINELKGKKKSNHEEIAWLD